MRAGLGSQRRASGRAGWVAPWAGWVCPCTRFSAPLSCPIELLPGRIEPLGQIRARCLHGYLARQKPILFKDMSVLGQMGQILCIELLQGESLPPAVALQSHKALFENIRPIRPGSPSRAIRTVAPPNATAPPRSPWVRGASSSGMKGEQDAYALRQLASP